VARADADGVWTETGLVERFESAQLPVKWRTPVGPGYSGPTVAGGRVFVMDRVTQPTTQERIRSLNAGTGREMWSYAYDCPYRGVQYEAGPVPRSQSTMAGPTPWAPWDICTASSQVRQAALDARLPPGIRR